MEAAEACGDVNPADHLREELAVQIGEEDADRAGPARDEASGATVRYIAKGGGDVVDASAGFFSDRTDTVEYA
jgi:hypothetical protein